MVLARDLVPAGHPRLHEEPLPIVGDDLLELGHDLRALRPGSYEAHVAPEGVEDLGQLVKAGLSQEGPEPGDPVVRLFRRRVVVLLDAHGPEFYHPESPASAPEPFLDEEGGTARLEDDRQGDEGPQGDGQSEGEGDDEIDQSLDEDVGLLRAKIYILEEPGLVYLSQGDPAEESLVEIGKTEEPDLLVEETVEQGPGLGVEIPLVRDDDDIHVAGVDLLLELPSIGGAGRPELPVGAAARGILLEDEARPKAEVGLVLHDREHLADGPVSADEGDAQLGEIRRAEAPEQEAPESDPDRGDDRKEGEEGLRRDVRARVEVEHYRGAQRRYHDGQGESPQEKVEFEDHIEAVQPGGIEDHDPHHEGEGEGPHVVGPVRQRRYGPRPEHEGDEEGEIEDGDVDEEKGELPRLPAELATHRTAYIDRGSLRGYPQWTGEARPPSSGDSSRKRTS
jgi:hypothetical protein